MIGIEVITAVEEVVGAFVLYAAAGEKETIIVCAHRATALADDTKCSFKPYSGNWKQYESTHTAVLSPGQAGVACWRDAPADYYLRFDVTFAPGASAALMLRGQPDDNSFWPAKTPLDAAYALYLDPVCGQISLRRWYQWDQRPPLAALPYKFTSQPCRIDLMLHGDILEVFIDNQRSLVSRLPEHPQGSLSLLAQDGTVEFRVQQCSVVC